MSEHVMVKDYERHKIVCGKCGLPWPCSEKTQEILKKISEEAKQQ